MYTLDESILLNLEKRKCLTAQIFERLKDMNVIKIAQYRSVRRSAAYAIDALSVTVECLTQAADNY